MTAPAAAPASGPIVAPAPRPAPQAPADRFAFAAVLDSLPGAAAKAGSSVGGGGSQASNGPRQGHEPSGQPDGYPMLGDGAFLSALPFALPPALATNVGRDTPVDLLSLLGPVGASLENNVATAEPATPAIARLTGERAFHFAASPSGGGPPTAGPVQADAASFAPAAIIESEGGTALAPLSMQGRGLTPDGAPSVIGADVAGLSSAEAIPATGAAPPTSKAPALVAARGVPAAANPSATQAPSTAQKSPLASAVARAASAAAPAAKTEPSDKAAEDPPPDPIASAGQSAPQGAAFNTQPSAAFAAAPSFGAYDTPAAAADNAPSASAPAAAQPSASPPVREIDVDLSPSGLENVSMTMRLSGDKLSVVINAGSSQTIGAIEGARDAIADRLAAIGQPLDSLVVKQTGANPDANANGNAASADEGSSGGEQGAGGGSGANDPPPSRRGASGGLRY
jgi:Flagellar hook-length control protein FliK